MNSISVVIITFNEEQKIAQCLDSVKDIADEIIVVDSHSTDATEAICDRYGAKFFTQDWLGYSDQKNLADDLATCDLIFSIDADEALSDELKQSIKALKDKEIAENEVFEKWAGPQTVIGPVIKIYYSEEKNNKNWKKKN